MKTIVFSNEKGGVGKTTLAFESAVGLALRDKHVLLIDGDPQGSQSKLLGQPGSGDLYRLLVNGVGWHHLLSEVPAKHWSKGLPTVGSIHLLKGDPSSVTIEDDPQTRRNLLILRNRLQEVSDSFDVCLIDTAPAPSKLHMYHYFAADGLIVPMRCAFLALAGIRDMFDHLNEHARMRREYGLNPLKLLGFVPMQFRDTRAHLKGRNFLEKRFGEKLIWDVLVERTVWEEREFYLQSIFLFAPKSKAAQEMNRIIDRIYPYTY